ncbi:MAG TPA: hypothetical protein VJ246_03015, partial [Patescibacteria group bacterium]|nr:hypothetical protein [Patescibacteria group bacterium]
CVGDWMKLWYGASPDTVIYGAASVQPSTTIKSPSAVFIGRLSEDTGVLVYVDAVLKMRGKVTLDIYGEGALLPKVLSRIRNSPYIRYTSVTHVPETIYKKYRFAFVSRYLGMIEAMQCGRQVFAHWNNSIKFDYLQSFPAIEDAFVFSGPGELIKQLQQTLDSPERANQRVKHAQVWALKQTWQKIADTYEELWTK